MKAMPVGEVKTHFSEVLEEVQQGNRIGILDGKIEIKFRDDFEMTAEELLDMQ
jgi:hypothetical protein